MPSDTPIGLLAALTACAFSLASDAANACDGPRAIQETSLPAIQAFIRDKRMTVLSFAGYSGAQYQEPEVMLERAARVLESQDPRTTLINIGATEVGIGAVYALAKRNGFTTMGIVSRLAREERVPLSKCVDYVFYVPDRTWGGFLAGTRELAPTSAALVAASASFVAIGGGDLTRDEMLAARAAGKPVTFIPADMNHDIARERARKRGAPEPTDFRGSAHAALAPGGGSGDKRQKTPKPRVARRGTTAGRMRPGRETTTNLSCSQAI